MWLPSHALRCLLAAAGLCLTPTPLSAQAPFDATDGAIEQLKPGEFLWAPAIAPHGPVTVIVSIRTQRAYAYRNGVPIGVSTVSTGKPGHETPTGVFTILQKEVDHKSNLYDDAPMPFMQRLTWTGLAMHAGSLPGYPASHGCVRMPRAFAKLLFGITKLGLTVVITDQPLAPEVAAAPSLITSPSSAGSAVTFAWQPERSPKGPLSIVISGRDRRVVVLRNGIRIGSSGIEIDGPVMQTEAFTLISVNNAAYGWLRLRLPGQLAGAAPTLTADERARGRLPEAFQRLLQGSLVLGSTLLITRDTIRSGGLGKSVTVIEADN